MSQVIPDDLTHLSFLSDFIYVGKKRGFDEQYLKLLGLGLIAGTARNVFYCETEWGKIYPNIFGLFVGESSIYAKTPTFKFAKSMISEKDQDIFLPTSGTFEGLLSTMNGTKDKDGSYIELPIKTGIIYVDEMGNWLGNAGKEYNKGFKESMLELFECNTIYKKLKSETIKIENPIVSFISGIQPGTFKAKITEADYLSGFIPRFLIAYPKNNPVFKEISNYDDIMKEDDRRLREKFEKIRKYITTWQSTVLNPVELSINIFREEYFNKSIENMLTASIYGKAMTYLYKVFILLYIDNIVNNTDNTEDIFLTHLSKKYVDDFLKDSLKLSLSLSTSVLSVLFEKVTTNIEKHQHIISVVSPVLSQNGVMLTEKIIQKGLSHSELYRKMNGGSSGAIHKEKFQQIIDDLIMMGRIGKVILGGKTKPTIYYFLKE